MKRKTILILFLGVWFAALDAGTIVYKTSPKDEEHILSDIKIISIAKKTVTIKYGSGVRTIPLGYLVSYYDSNIKIGDFADNTCDYSVTISSVEMPATGYEYKKVNKKKKKTTGECEIEFSVSKKTEKGKSKNIRMPYFYLFILTTSTESYGRRPVYTFCYPDEAKVNLKTYDEARIIEVVNAMERPLLYNDGASTRLGTGHKSLSYASGCKPISISLKGIKDRRIIAYHLEVWGKKEMVVQKDWKDSTYKIGNNWWKRY
ncbi:MAG: hypothetical protein PHV59_00735 [Victivallales bacterium]|nr:hypothetical protein [Victivallales bacterium]